MNCCRKLKTFFLALALLALLPAQDTFACAACYGKSDSPMAWGMNAGIMTLLVVIGVVLSGIAGFFVYIVKRSAKFPDSDPNNPNQH